MRVIFLDFDGVVVCLPQEWDYTLDGKRVHALNRDAVARLNRVVEATGAVVVVSSSWRHHQALERLSGYLRRAGFVGEVIDITPDLATLGGRLGLVYEAGERGHEVAVWLAEHPEVESYVVLDDDADKGPLPSERWILVKDGWFNGGLQDSHARRAIALLNQAVLAEPA